MPAEFYHCAPLMLGPGSVVSPGNWGRIKRRFEVDALKLLREVVFDDIRKREFADKPSRLECAFACPSIEAAEAYRAKNAQAGIIYKVELMEPDAPFHTADYQLFEMSFLGIDGAEDLARRYWRGEDTGCPEVLTESSLLIVDCVDRSYANLLARTSPVSE